MVKPEYFTDPTIQGTTNLITEIVPWVEDPRTTLNELGAMAIIGGLGIFGNGLVLIGLLPNKSIRQRLSIILVLNQALVDFISSLLFIATYLSLFFKKHYDERRQWICFLIDSEYLE